MEDNYKFQGDIDIDCVLSGEVPTSIRGLTRFLRRLHERAPDLLPSWWDKCKDDECKRIGMTSGAWEYLGHAVEKADIMEHYGDPYVPMQLRMFAEPICGSHPSRHDREVTL